MLAYAILHGYNIEVAGAVAGESNDHVENVDTVSIGWCRRRHSEASREDKVYADRSARGSIRRSCLAPIEPKEDFERMKSGRRRQRRIIWTGK